MTHTAPHSLHRSAGITWIACGLLSIAFMLHHPSIGSDTLPERLQELSNKAMISAWVHGLLIVLMTGLFYGGVGLSQRLGLQRTLPVLALILFGLGTLAYMLAAIVSGFITPDLGEYFNRHPEQLASAESLLRAAWAANQAFARAGLIATAAAMTCWSAALCSQPGLRRWVGLAGLLLALIPAALLLTGHLALQVTGMTATVIAVSVWYMLAGFWLMRSRNS